MAKNTSGESINIKNSINIFLNNYFNGIAFAFFIILLITGYFFLIRPKYAQITKNTDVSSAEEEAEYRKQADYLSQLRDLDKEFKSINPEDIEKISNILPYELSHEILFAQMEKIVTQNGYILTSLNINAGDAVKKKSRSAEGGAVAPEAAQIGAVKKLGLTMSIKGTDYSGFKKMLSALENNLRLMDINSLSFDPAENGINLEITTYYLEQ